MLMLIFQESLFVQVFLPGGRFFVISPDVIVTKARLSLYTGGKNAMKGEIKSCLSASQPIRFRVALS